MTTCDDQRTVGLYMTLKSHVAGVQRQKNNRAAFGLNMLSPVIDQGICRKHVLQRRQAFLVHYLLGLGYGWLGCMVPYGRSRTRKG